MRHTKHNYYIFQEYCDEIRSGLSVYPRCEKSCIQFLKEICVGFLSLYQKMAVHGGFKNYRSFTFHQGKPKIIDFGMTNLYDIVEEDLGLIPYYLPLENTYYDEHEPKTPTSKTDV